MIWIDEDGNQTDISDMEELCDIQISSFIFRFEDLTEMQSSNVIFYIESHKKIYMLDFIDWLDGRNIQYKILYQFFNHEFGINKPLYWLLQWFV